MHWEFHATDLFKLQITLNVKFPLQFTIAKIFTLVQALARLWYIWAFLRQVYQAKLWEMYLISPLLLIFHHCYKFITIRADADYAHSSNGTQIVHVGLPEWGERIQN